MTDKEPFNSCDSLTHIGEVPGFVTESQHDHLRPQASYLRHLETLQLLLPCEHRLQPAHPGVDVPDQHELPDAPGQDAKRGAQVLEKVFDEARVLLVAEHWSDKSTTVAGLPLPGRSCARTEPHANQACTAGHWSAK